MTVKEVSAGLFVSTVVAAALLALGQENFRAPELLTCVGSGLLVIGIIAPFSIRLLTRNLR
ncbi:hypothetical protein HYS82_03890 [Candidatus Amesbacteria bacterium]|nr:hypothetical protein [Candidatus Amesbacteria bacterium]